LAGKIEKFEDLNVLKEAISLTIEIYKNFRNCKYYGFRDQIKRSAMLYKLIQTEKTKFQ